MQHLRFALAFALLGTPAAACAEKGQPTPAAQPGENSAEAQPGAKALELAQLLAPSTLIMVRRISKDEAAAELTRHLLLERPATKGPGCDPRQADCTEAARRVATRHAADYARFRNQFADEIYARLFEAKMSPAEIDAALAFARTDAGRALAAALRLSDTRQDAELLKGIAARVRSKGPDGFVVPYDEFYEATEGLPRRSMGIAPPAPKMPPPAKDR